MPITIWGYTVYEPMTVFTNLLLTALCWFYFWNQRTFRLNWALFFLLLGTSTLFGAIGHGYSDQLDNPVKLWSRVAAIGSVLFAGMSSTRVLNNPRSRSVLQTIVVAQSVIALVWLLFTNSFIPVKLNSIIGLGVIVLGIHLYLLNRASNLRDLWIVAGIAINASAAIVHTYKWNLGANFTYHDIGHVVLMIGIFVMYRGIRAYSYDDLKSVAPAI